MSKFLHMMKNENMRIFLSSLIICMLAFTGFAFIGQAYAASVTLTATVATSLTFTTSSNNFGTITPGTYLFATTTLDVLTNDTNGWNVTLYGNNTTVASTSMQYVGNNTIQIPDQTQWVNGVATSSAGNAVIRTSLTNSGNVLAFRVMTASSSNGNPFYAPSWWGASDVDGTAAFAGIASSTVQRTIGNAGVGSYSSTDHLNTVQYYLNVSASQATGNYSAPLTYTATGN